MEPVQIAIDHTSPPHIWAVFKDPFYGDCSLWKRPLMGDHPWVRVEGPELEPDE